MSIEPGCSSPSHTPYQPQSYKRISLEPDSDQVNHLYITPIVIASEAKQSRGAERSIGRDCFIAHGAPRNDSVPTW
jgi:hypothetical protein